MINATLEKLSDMKLHAMAQKAEELNSSPKAKGLGAVEFLSFCVDAEYDSRTPRSNYRQPLWKKLISSNPET